MKFIQDGKTYVRVPKDYITNSRGSPYGEFFLVVLTGREDEQRSFLLSVSDMLKVCEEVDDDGKAVLRLHGATLIEGSNYEITQQKLALDRIEHALKAADFWDNRQFIRGISRYVKLSADQIDHDLMMPLDNWWGDIQKEFFKGKRKIQSTLFDVEEIADSLSKIVSATDPMEALRIYEEEIADHVGRGGLGNEIQIRLDFFDEDFFAVVRNHRARLAKLKELGLEGNYFKLMDVYNKQVLKQLQKLASKEKPKAVKISVTYDKDTLRNVAVSVSSASLKKHEAAQVITSEQGLQTVVVRVGEDAGKTDGDGKDVVLRQLRQPFQRALDSVYLGGELDE